jgi:hypothetical protein
MDRNDSSQLSALFAHTPHLRSFTSLAHLDVAPITVLSMNAGQCLTDLHLLIDNSNQTMLHTLVRFSRLKDLRLVFHPAKEVTLAGIQPWHLPSLMRLSWKWVSAIPTSEGLCFLSLCRFNPTCKFELNLYLLEPGQSVHLNMLFDNHPKSHVIIRTAKPLSVRTNILGVRRVDFESSLPPPMIFARVQLPEHVTLMCSGCPGSESSIWELLSVLASQRGPLSSPSFTLQVTNSETFGWRFKWYKHGAISDQLAQFTGRILQKAIQLRAHNVVILDELGTDLNTAINNGMLAPPAFP